MSNILKKKPRQKECLKDTAAVSYSEPKQFTLAESCDRIHLNDSGSHRIHQQIGEMIVIDFQPLLVVEDWD